jgi:hypothetical protein
MPLNISIAPRWKGRYPMVDTADEQDLEMRSAINQMVHRMPAPQAEAKAHEDYKHDKIVEAAAHHLNGMTASHAIGNDEAARKHGAMYVLAMKALNHKDLVTPPDEVASKAKNATEGTIARFKSHKGDLFTVPILPGDDSQAPRQNEKQVKEGAKT